MCLLGTDQRLNASGQHINFRPQGSGEILFSRVFSPTADALYVPDGNWKDFCLEAPDRLSEPDLMGKSVDLHSGFRSVAVSETLFQQDDLISYLPEAGRWYEGLQVLYVVVGPQPNGKKGPWRWPLEGLDGGVFLWNRDKEEFVFQEGSAPSGKGLYDRIREGAERGLREPLIECDLESFMLQPVFTARK